VIFDGIVLSGPRLHVTGDSLSPARLQVVRYLRGHGPRIVRVATSFRQGEAAVPTVGGTFAPEPGEVLRIFGETPRGAGSSTARGVLEPSPCGGFAVRDPGSHLRALGRSTTIATSTQGGAAWRARALRGRGGLRCVRFQPTNRTGSIDRSAECAARPGPRKLLLGIAATSQGTATTTAVVVAARTLRSVRLETPDGDQRIRALGGPLPMAVAVLHGFVDPTQIEVHATFRGGRTSEVELAARRADAPDPGGQGSWAVFGQDAHPRRAGGICTSFWQPLPRFRDLVAAPLPEEACGRLGRRGHWFAVRSTIATPPVGTAAPVRRTVVAGAVGRGVSAVTVTAGGAQYPVAVARSGRAFLSVLPADVAATDIAVAFRLRNGATRVYTGRSTLGVVHIRRDAL
jgi:hypothetical protein